MDYYKQHELVDKTIECWLERVVCPICKSPLQKEISTYYEVEVAGKISCSGCSFKTVYWDWLGGSIDLFASQQESLHRDQIEHHSQLIKSVSDWGTPTEWDEERNQDLDGYDYGNNRIPSDPDLVFGKYYHDYTKELILKEIANYTRQREHVSILEIGCGHGIMAPFLLERLGEEPDCDVEYLMTDIVEDSMRKSERFFKATGFDWRGKIKAFICNGEKIPLPDSCMDIVFLMEAIEHFERPFIGFREFHRVLKPGGLCLITTPRPSQSFFFFRVKLFGKLFPYYGYAKHLMIDFSICDENFFKLIQQVDFKQRKQRFLNVNFPLINQYLLQLLHFPAIVRLYASFNLKILSRFFPLFRRAQFRVLEK